MRNQLKNQDGAIAIFLVSVLAILLLVTTTFAARLQVSELNQSSNIDRSEQAYYAAEAGVEEAIRRLDRNPDADINVLFGCNSSGGDQADLSDLTAVFRPDCEPTSQAAKAAVDSRSLSWRNRLVTPNSILSGVLVKDESAQFDASNLSRSCVGGTLTTGTADCMGGGIYQHFLGLEFNWTPLKAGATAKMELTVVSWPAGNLTKVTTQKLLMTTSAACSGGHPSCFYYQVDPGRRYIFRVKALFENVGNASAADQNSYAVKYAAALKDSQNYVNPLIMANDAVLIDVVGQAGDIRRRIIAKKQRGGRLLGIFDYVLYSGDPDIPLCKPGVDPVYDQNCIANPIDND